MRYGDRVSGLDDEAELEMLKEMLLDKYRA